VKSEGRFCCPSCHAALIDEGSSWACSACALRFPLCAGIPILVGDAEAGLAQAQSSIRRGLGAINRFRRSLIRKTWSPDTRDVLRQKAIVGLDTNRSALRRIAEYLPPQLLFEPEATPADWLYKDFDIVFRYAVRDWSGTPWDEDQVKTIESTILAGLQAHAARRDAALVLGSGTCRLAHDLTGVFENVMACELSISMMLTYVAIRDGALDYIDIRFQNSESASDQVRKMNLSSSRQCGVLPEARRERLSLIIADGTALPLETGSIHVVLSVYFTDVVPLSKLLPEMKRVLADDGLFVHFGTLGYHRSDYSEMLSVDEVRDSFKQIGFVIEKELWVSTRDIGARPDKLAVPLLRNWFFVARKVSTPGPSSL
jgi:SAM-dependent methyltransferase